MPRDLYETLETISTSAGRPDREDPAAHLRAIAEAATAPLSDRGSLQVGAALADALAQRGADLPFADRAGVVALLVERLGAHGVLVREALS